SGIHGEREERFARGTSRLVGVPILTRRGQSARNASSRKIKMGCFGQDRPTRDEDRPLVAQNWEVSRGLPAMTGPPQEAPTSSWWREEGLLEFAAQEKTFRGQHKIDAQSECVAKWNGNFGGDADNKRRSGATKKTPKRQTHARSCGAGAGDSADKGPRAVAVGE